jgi:hypothetical protein
MTKAPESAPAGNFFKTSAQEVEDLIRQLIKPGNDLIEEVKSEIARTNPFLLVGAAKISQLLLFLKENFKPKQYKQALADSLGWASSIANQLLKLAPILGNFTNTQLEQIEANLSSSAVYNLATGRTPVEVIQAMLEKACTQEVSQKDIQTETKKHKQNQPRKESTLWRYVGNGREYQPPRISEKAGLAVEQLSKQNNEPRRFVIEEAILLLLEKLQQPAFAIV